MYVHTRMQMVTCVYSAVRDVIIVVCIVCFD